MAAAIDEKISVLRQELVRTKEDISNILNLSTAEDRELTSDESMAVEALQADYKKKERELNIYTQQTAIESHANEVQSRVTDPDDLVEAQPEPVQAAQPEQKKHVVVSHMRRLADERILASSRHGFHSLGHWAKAVMNSKRSGEMDERLKVVRATQQESVGADGGFLVPPEFSDRIIDVVLGDSVQSLAGRAWQIPVQGNIMRLPLNMDTPYGTGIRAYWGAEASTHTRTDANLEQASLTMHKVTALVPVTEELMEDAPAVGAMISSQAPAAIAWEIGNAMINGNGQNRPTGIMNSATAATVTIAKESGQNADTIVKNNLFKMMAALPADSQNTAVWLVSPTAQTAVWEILHDGKGMPGRGLEQAPYDSILSRPIIQHLACQPIGDKGDVILADFSKYAFIYKSSGVRSAMSIHMMFDQDISLLKFQMRCNGLSAWSKSIDVANGNHKLSPFVCLANRA